ncbi:MAG: hypothetical protein AAGD22_09900 [Verrucomicrobiota bacterium]
MMDTKDWWARSDAAGGENRIQGSCGRGGPILRQTFFAKATNVAGYERCGLRRLGAAKGMRSSLPVLWEGENFSEHG